MKTIIAGSRKITRYAFIEEAVAQSHFVITEVVSGCAEGVDLSGEEYAEHNNIPIKRFPADWKGFGYAAGKIRNHEMADYAEALIAIWNGKSPGTRHMIETAHDAGLEVFVYYPYK